jgi:uncharacterized protein (TIGR00369 family)
LTEAILAALDVAAADQILADNFAPWVLALGIGAETVGADEVMLRIPFSEKPCRVGGILCGQALISGADKAMVIALAAANGGLKPCTTVNLTINYMRLTTKADAVLEAKAMRLGKSRAFCTTEIREAGNAKPAGFATGT